MPRKKLTPEEVANRQVVLRHTVRHVYDLQKLRISEGNRAGRQAEHAEAEMDEKHKEWMSRSSDALHDIEKDGFKEIKRLLRGIPIYDEWLEQQKGVGPAMAGVLLAEIDVHKAHTVSHVWSYCGLAVDSKYGEAARRRKGEKAGYNPWLKAKVLEVLGGSFLKSNSPWRKFYDDRKHRRQNQHVDKCPVCKGTGKYTSDSKKIDCYGCDGGKKTGPFIWGKSDAHRHRDALRYMVKMFLAQFWEEWRRREGLTVRVPYPEEYLGKKHHAA